MFDQNKTSTLEKINEITNYTNESNADRSKKGSADIQIIPLINTINNHKDYITTSSCAGRTVLTKLKTKHKHDAEWLFESHDPVDSKLFLEQIKSIEFDEHPVWFKAEPPILHIVCRNIDAAHRLLVAAKESSLKRSGIISCKKRIIVEIIGNIRVETIAAKNNSLLLSEDYLKIMLEEANTAMELNRCNLQALVDKISMI